MSRSRSSNQLYLLVGVGLPGLILLGSRFVGTGPAGAKAQSSFEAAPALPLVLSERSTPSPEVTRVVEAAQRFARDLGIPTPFELATVTLDDDDRTGSAAARSGSISADVRVSAILLQPGQTFAVVDGKAFALGAEVAPGWILDEVDARSNQVRLRHISGATETHAIHSFD